jgi:hypothetical protein
MVNVSYDHVDRGTATAWFLSLFPFTHVDHVATEESDHMALVIRVADVAAVGREQGSRGFAFEEMWTKHEDYDRMIKDAWENRLAPEMGIQGLWGQLHDMSKTMQKWSFETFGSIKAEIKLLRGKLADAQSNALISGSSLEVHDIEKKLHDIFEKEEIMYKQSSRQEWLKAGDRNTRYFQNRASHRRRKNTVRYLRREDGSLCNTNKGMRELALHFYQQLYSSEGSMTRV